MKASPTSVTWTPASTTGAASPPSPQTTSTQRDPWTHLEELEKTTESKGYLLLERLALHPVYAKEAETWVEEKLRSHVWAGVDAGCNDLGARS